MDVFELLNRDVRKKDLDKEDKKEKERCRRKKPDRTWSSWLPGFLVYAGVVITAQPCGIVAGTIPLSIPGFDLQGLCRFCWAGVASL